MRLKILIIGAGCLSVILFIRLNQRNTNNFDMNTKGEQEIHEDLPVMKIALCPTYKYLAKEIEDPGLIAVGTDSIVEMSE